MKFSGAVAHNKPRNESDTRTRLTNHLHYVGRTVPFYRTLGCEDGRPIEEFPLVVKSEIRSNYAAFISDRFADIRPRLAEFLERDQMDNKTFFGALFGNDIIVDETSGSDGAPFRCPKTISDRVRLGMGIWRQRRAVDPLAQDRNLYRFLHGLTLPRFNHRDCDLANLRLLYDDIRNSRARWLHAPPWILKQHLKAFHQLGWRPVLPELRVIECTAGFLREPFATDLRNFFGTIVVSQYGLMEAWAVALTCIHNVHHINDHNVYVEILDDANRPAPIDVVGRVAVTSLKQQLLPVVRYVTGDLGMFVEKRCDCKLGNKTLTLIEGRESELIKGVPGLVFGNILFRDAARVWRLAGCSDLRYLRVIQVAPDDFVVHTNAIRQPVEFCSAFKRETIRLLGKAVRLQHVIVNDAEILRQEQRKPWLFRCEC